MNKRSPPAPDEFEISVFGGGIGECIVIHLGNGQWAVIDSCRNSSTRRPTALEYFGELGICVENQVSLVVITHWHDDHCDGISDVIQNARAASVVISSALRSEEFHALLNSHNEMKLIDASSGVRELYESLSFCQENNPHRVGPHFWATEGAVLCQPDDAQLTEIRAISPSAQTVSKAAVHTGQLLPAVDAPMTRIRDVSPNALSIALQVKFGSLVCLLGGDLEYSKDKLSGWIAASSSNVKIQEKSRFYKVAHHGSEGADGNEIWNLLLHERPVAVATTYARGKKKLPTVDDIGRITARADKLYITSPKKIARPKRPHAAEKTISEVAKNRTVMPTVPGHVRMRFTEDRGLIFDTFDGAKIA